MFLLYLAATNFRFSVELLFQFTGNPNANDRMVVRFTTTYAIIAYHHWCYEFKSRTWRGVQHYLIQFISVLRQGGSFPRVLRFPPPIKLIATI